MPTRACYNLHKMQDSQAFALWLKRRRKALDLTREALAKLAHCSVSTVRRLEANDLRPSRQLAESLAGALQIPPDQQEAFVQFARGGGSGAVSFTLKAEALVPAFTLAPIIFRRRSPV